MSFLERFTGRAAAYSASRPGYPPAILEILAREIGFDRTRIVADIGSGTGLLSKIFVENGNRVFAIEPNDEMRLFAEKEFAKYAEFLSVIGTAEHTTLPDASVDLVTVGQALHWFDLELSKREFARIVKIDGHVCVVYNNRDKADEFMAAYDRLIQKYARNRAPTPEINGDYLSRFFADGNYSRFHLSNMQALDFDGLLGRMTSASYMPNSAEPERFRALRDDAGALFKSYQHGGRVRMLYDTEIFIGKVRP